ncbi:AraC-type DNA-binding protein [Fictibacillus enclensis]|uniref:Transcriptional regulator n=1 Tax=Fictibacillus enclensis TaxID=1017270 RepID=A0A0V8IYG3_9BACL|nr:AraC family transcriptional regulator [Fictibacillus enclensis]KSU79796.1 transcriptional regulator [Fictibacillus enclensis]SCC39900.1 AraC-type DNA-binding protein [Fictibacillus enclensis]
MQMKNFKIDQNLKELTPHRTVVLPIACYKTTINQNIHGYIPLHWHDEIQFVLMVKGEAAFQVNEEKRLVKEGDGLFINSGCLHKAEEVNQPGSVYICLNVSPHFVLSQELYTTYVYPYVQATNLPCIYLDHHETWAKNSLEAVTQIHQLIQQKPSFYEITITTQLISLWQNLILNGFHLEHEQTEVVKSQRMKKMLNWIHEHYGEKVKLDNIAKAGQLSRSECCRYFKKILKKSPMNYVTEYRIQQSLILLQQQESNVTEVAYQVGFNSTSYFIDTFRKSIKMTPLTYKRKAAKTPSC